MGKTAWLNVSQHFDGVGGETTNKPNLVSAARNRQRFCFSDTSLKNGSLNDIIYALERPG
jgi:hypothetical protein